MAAGKYAKPTEAQLAEDHGGAPGQGAAPVVLALITSVLAAAAQIAASVITHSASTIAASTQSVANSASQLLVLRGVRRGRAAATEDNPYGYGRDQHYWGFVVALVLFAAGAATSVYLGIRRLDEPEALERPEWALGALGAALLVKVVSWLVAARRAEGLRGDVGFARFVRRAKSPELPVVLIEDIAAVAAIVVALAGVGVSEVTDEPRWDAAGSIGVGVVLVAAAIAVVVAMKGLLVGEGATRKEIEAIRGAIEIEPEVLRLVHMRTQHLGPDEILVGAQAEFQHDMSVAEVADVVKRVEDNIRANVPMARVVYIEPDVDDSHRLETHYVTEHAGHIDPDDPDYATITGQVPKIVVDDDIWS